MEFYLCDSHLALSARTHLCRHCRHSAGDLCPWHAATRGDPSWKRRWTCDGRSSQQVDVPPQSNFSHAVYLAPVICQYYLLFLKTALFFFLSLIVLVLVESNEQSKEFHWPVIPSHFEGVDWTLRWWKMTSCLTP